jgi:hypothetical protein
MIALWIFFAILLSLLSFFDALFLLTIRQAEIGSVFSQFFVHKNLFNIKIVKTSGIM